jgi:hypothetical protein
VELVLSVFSTGVGWGRGVRSDGRFLAEVREITDTANPSQRRPASFQEPAALSRRATGLRQDSGSL